MLRVYYFKTLISISILFFVTWEVLAQNSIKIKNFDEFRNQLLKDEIKGATLTCDRGSKEIKIETKSCAEFTKLREKKCYGSTTYGMYREEHYSNLCYTIKLINSSTNGKRTFFNTTLIDWWKEIPVEIISIPGGIYTDESYDQEKEHLKSFIGNKETLGELDFIEVTTKQEGVTLVISESKHECGKIRDVLIISPLILIDINNDNINDLLIESSRLDVSSNCWLGTSNSLGATSRLILVKKSLDSRIDTYREPPIRQKEVINERKEDIKTSKIFKSKKNISILPTSKNAKSNISISVSSKVKAAILLLFIVLILIRFRFYVKESKAPKKSEQCSTIKDDPEITAEVLVSELVIPSSWGTNNKKAWYKFKNFSFNHMPHPINQNDMEDWVVYWNNGQKVNNLFNAMSLEFEGYQKIEEIGMYSSSTEPKSLNDYMKDFKDISIKPNTELLINTWGSGTDNSGNFYFIRNDLRVRPEEFLSLLKCHFNTNALIECLYLTIVFPKINVSWHGGYDADYRILLNREDAKGNLNVIPKKIKDHLGLRFFKIKDSIYLSVLCHSRTSYGLFDYLIRIDNEGNVSATIETLGSFNPIFY